MEKAKPLCLECADLDHLMFLPRGDAALTRRSRKYSTLSAVVVKSTRSRERYEARACSSNRTPLSARGRMPQRRRKAPNRAGEGRARARTSRPAVRRTIPRCRRSRYLDCPVDEAERCEDAREKYSGRVGRSAAAKSFDATAIEPAVMGAFGMHTSTIGYCREGGNERRRGRLCRTE